jgi:hypothetical protein
MVSLFLAALGFALGGCTASETDDAEASVQNLDATEIGFNVFGAASEKRTVAPGSDSESDPRTAAMTAQMLPVARARMATALAEACAAVTGGAGRLDGQVVEEEMRAERIYRATEFIVEVRGRQTCAVKRSVLEGRAAELVKLYESELVWTARAALLPLKEKAVPATIAAIDARIRADGKLDTAEDQARGVTNWTVNHVIRLAKLLGDLETTSPRAIEILQKLRAAVASGNGVSWAQSEIDRVLATLRVR